jgi:hypothetical protein
MQKYFMLIVAMAAIAVPASVFAQSATGTNASTGASASTTVTRTGRDPNPPYGAAAGVNPSTNRASNPAGQTPAGGAQQAMPTQSGAQPGIVSATRPGPGAATSGSSSTATTQGSSSQAPGAAIASRGTTTAAGAAAATPYDPSSTPGWSMMTPQEQQTYSGRMSGFTSLAQCRAYQQAYMAQIEARARSMGQIVQSQGSDPCATLQQQGSLK